MSRFSRFFLGGMVGAGLALILSPKSGKEIRNLLLGAGRKQLPPSPPQPVRSYAPEPEPAATADLESRIEETRRQVQSQLEEAFMAPGPEETVAVETEAPAAAEPEPEPVAEVEPVEAAAEAAPVAEPEAEAAAEPEPEVELEAAAGEEEPAAPAPAAEPEALPAADSELLPAAAPAVEEPQEEAEVDDMAALKTPAEGEPTLESEPAPEEKPTLEAELTVSEGPATGAEPAPSGIDRDEMRRRIDETRARLKAKAFDAMVTGETFIEGEGSPAPEKEEKTAPGPEIDRETDEKIDETLKEQD